MRAVRGRAGHKPLLHDGAGLFVGRQPFAGLASEHRDAVDVEAAAIGALRDRKGKGAVAKRLSDDLPSSLEQVVAAPAVRLDSDLKQPDVAAFGPVVDQVIPLPPTADS